MTNRTTPVELTNMVMIENPETGKILVQNRVNPKWSGVVFPGGHIEPGETITESVIREAREETGLIVTEPQLVGLKEWTLSDDARYLVFLYKATTFTGALTASREGDLFWTTREALTAGTYATPNTFLEMLPVFDQPELNELALLGPSGQRTPIWQ